MLDASDSMEVSFDRLISSGGSARSPVNVAWFSGDSETSLFGRIAGDAELGEDDDCFLPETIPLVSLGVLVSRLLCLERNPFLSAWNTPTGRSAAPTTKVERVPRSTEAIPDTGSQGPSSVSYSWDRCLEKLAGATD